jgi:hypothetical protein
LRKREIEKKEEENEIIEIGFSREQKLYKKTREGEAAS